LVGNAARHALVSQSAALDFEEFFRAEYGRLVRTVYLLTRNGAEAEEIAQEAMARTYERWDRVRTLDSPAGYVYRTALNLNRKRLRWLAVRARPLTTAPAQADVDAALENQSEFSRALDTLPIGQRQALVLVAWLGMSAEEAGTILGIKPASVRSRVHRARTTLRQLLGGRDG
jgi:RNA polymerase sigma factor (sigma-70 family)